MFVSRIDIPLKNDKPSCSRTQPPNLRFKGEFDQWEFLESDEEEIDFPDELKIPPNIQPPGTLREKWQHLLHRMWVWAQSDVYFSSPDRYQRYRDYLRNFEYISPIPKPTRNHPSPLRLVAEKEIDGNVYCVKRTHFPTSNPGSPFTLPLLTSISDLYAYTGEDSPLLNSFTLEIDNGRTLYALLRPKTTGKTLEDYELLVETPDKAGYQSYPLELIQETLTFCVNLFKNVGAQMPQRSRKGNH